MRKSNITVGEALQKLRNNLFSGSDPVFYKGEETTPDDLEMDLDEFEYARNVKIKFYGIRAYSKSCELRLLDGTLASIVSERRRTIKE